LPGDEPAPVEIVGIGDVSIGTDPLGIRGCIEHTRWAHLVAAMLRGDFKSEEAGLGAD